MRTICDRIGCLEQKHKRYNFCLKHQRLSSMARAANTKYVQRDWERITGAQIESLFVDSFPDGDMRCPMCNTTMLWTGDRKRVISIQHNNIDMTLSFLCCSCNTKDASVDTHVIALRRRHLPKSTKFGEKVCSICGEQKLCSKFGKHYNVCNKCVYRRQQEKKPTATLKIQHTKKPPNAPGKKCCAACLEQKSHSEFHRNKHTLDGYISRCKQCRKDNRFAFRQRKNR